MKTKGFIPENLSLMKYYRKLFRLKIINTLFQGKSGEYQVW
jgi:hypothetical protein